jgi:putative DNA primase/helicase
MQPLSTPRGYRPFSMGNGSGSGDIWQAPEPLVAQNDTAPYPIDALPNSIRQAVDEVQLFVQAPIEMVASSALTALSIACQQLADVRRADKLCGPVNLYLLTVAESGERKSSVDGYFMQPIRDHERAQREKAKSDLANHSAEMAAWEASRGAVVDRLGKAAKDSKDVDAPKADLANLEASKPVSPRIPRLLYGDVTSEKLTRDLATNWPAAGIVSSEAGAVFGGHSMGKDSAMRTMSAINELWSGNTITVDRATSESFQVRNARLTIGLQVQPSVLATFMERERNSRGSGFLARFLFSAPASTQGTRRFREAPSQWPSLEAFNARIAELLSVTPNIDADGGLCLPLLDFTPEAKAAWIGWHDLIESQLGPTGDLANVRDLASKAADNLARLAALFHIYETGAMGAIGLEAVNAAAPIILWHTDQGRNYLGTANLSPDVASAAALDRWLIETCQSEGATEISRRKVQQFGPGAVRDRAALMAALEELADHNRVREAQDGRQKVIRINPALLNGVANAA